MKKMMLLFLITFALFKSHPSISETLIFPYSCKGHELAKIQISEKNESPLIEYGKSFFQLLNGGKNYQGENISAWGYLEIEGTPPLTFDFSTYKLAKILKQNVYRYNSSEKTWVTLKDYVNYYMFIPEDNEVVEKILVAVPSLTKNNPDKNPTAFTEVYLTGSQEPILFFSSCIKQNWIE